MKREITYKGAGKKSDGTQWFMLVFGCALVGEKLYNECRQFVTESIYKAVKVGQSLEIV
jgi:hypothetical protein